MKIINAFITFVIVISSIFRVDLGYGMNPTNKKIDLSKYRLAWSDEFDGDELDHNKWNDSQTVTMINRGAVRKGGFWHKDMIAVENGALHIKSRYVDEEQAANYGDDYRAGWYSGCVTTIQSNPEDTTNPDEFLYGYIEARCILPAGEGIWPAFWMLNEGMFNVDGSAEDGAEIDIMECFAYKFGEKATSQRVQSHIHWDGYETGHSHYFIGNFYPNNPYTEYNTYGMEWTPDEYILYINGCECARTKRGVSRSAEGIILSVETSGTNGVAGLNHGDITKNGDNVDFIIDYVRVYQ